MKWAKIEKWDAICFKCTSEVHRGKGNVHPASLFEGKHKRPVSGVVLFGGLKINFVSAIVLITSNEG